MSYFNSLVNSIKEGNFFSKLYRFSVAIVYKILNFGLLRIIFNSISPNRRKIKRFEKKITMIDSTFEKVGNYFLPKESNLGSNSKFISFGIGADVDFEASIYKKYGTKAICFDPKNI